jgi:hypothetical protein
LSISLMGWFDSPNCCISSPAVAKGNSSRNWLTSVPNTWRGRPALDQSIQVESPSVKHVDHLLTWDREYTIQPRTLHNFLWIFLGVALWGRGIWWQSSAPIVPSVEPMDF